MTSEHNFEKLSAHILALSENQITFDDAKKEWELDEITCYEEPAKCPCGVRIKERCYIVNNANANRTYVGNVCIDNFMGINTKKLFDGLKRITDDPENAKPNKDLIEYAMKKGFLYSDNEKKFLDDVKFKKKFTPKQKHWLQKINRRIVKKIVVGQPDLEE